MHVVLPNYMYCPARYILSRIWFHVLANKIMAICYRPSIAYVSVSTLRWRVLGVRIFSFQQAAAPYVPTQHIHIYNFVAVIDEID